MTVEQAARAILKPFGAILTEFSDKNLVDAILVAKEGKEVLFIVNDIKHAPDDRIENMTRLLDEKLIYRHRPFYLNFQSGGRISTRIFYEDSNFTRGFNPDLIIYNKEDFIE